MLLFSHFACFVLNKLKKQSNTTYQFCPLPHIQRLFMQKCSWGEEGCSCYQLLLLSFFPNFTCLTNQTIQSKNSCNSIVVYQNRHGWTKLFKTRGNIVKILSHKCRSVAGEGNNVSCYQLLLLSFFPGFTCWTNQTAQCKITPINVYQNSQEEL